MIEICNRCGEEYDKEEIIENEYGYCLNCFNKTAGFKKYIRRF